MPGQRADARRNRERILDVARVVVREQGTQASLRDIARRAEVGLGTLYRHFPSREALLETLMRRRFEHLGARAAELAGRLDTAAGLAGHRRGPGALLEAWLIEFAHGSAAYRGMPAEIMATLADGTSALHATSVGMRDAAARLLSAAQATGEIRADLSAAELFAFINGIGWLAEHDGLLARERMLALLLQGLTKGPASPAATGPAGDQRGMPVSTSSRGSV